MDRRINGKEDIGTWIIHHTHKLQGVNLAATDYEEIGFAGKCGITLNALAASAECELTMDRVRCLGEGERYFQPAWNLDRILENPIGNV